MELTLPSLSFASLSKAIRDCKPRVHNANNWNSQEQRRKKSMVTSALPETAISVVITAGIVGAAATYLARTTKSSEKTDTGESSIVCEACGGSGICAECKGEGFVVKRLTDERAQKARLASTTAATRYTAGLPKKWSYCTKCSSARSCSTCGGSGRLSL